MVSQILYFKLSLVLSTCKKFWRKIEMRNQIISIVIYFSYFSSKSILIIEDSKIKISIISNDTILFKINLNNYIKI